MMHQQQHHFIVPEGDGIMRSTAATATVGQQLPATTTTTMLNEEYNYRQQQQNHMNTNNYNNRDSYEQNSRSSSTSSSSSSSRSSVFCCSSSTMSSLFTCCTTVHIICNTIFIIGLCVMVSLMAVQIHNIQQQLVVDENEIAALKEQVDSQTQNQQDLNQRVDEEHSLTMYQMAGTFTLLTCLITAFHITQHLSNYNEPVVQRKIIAILWMSPIYSVTSFLSLIFPTVDEYLAVIKDCYEAYTIYTFLSFLIAVLGRGDRNAAIQVLACHADHLRPPTKCLSFLYNKNSHLNIVNHPTTGTAVDEDLATTTTTTTNATAIASAVLTECQILAMQFVFIRPITSLLLFISDTILEGRHDNNLDDPNSAGSSIYSSYLLSPNFYIAIITNISVFFAFNGLLKFYHAVRDDLKWCQPFNKFVSIKSIVFLTFWQGLLISIIVNVNYPTTSTNNNTTTIDVPTLSPTRIPDIYPIDVPMPTPITIPTSPSIPSPSSSMATPFASPTTPIIERPTNNNDKSHNSTRLLRRQYQQQLLQHLRFLDDHTVTTPNDDGVDRSEENDSNEVEEGDIATNDTTDNPNNQQGYDEGNDTNQSNDDTQHQRASHIQNFLICFEMLLFAIGHWCVFPAEEWKPDYRPQTTYGTPGFGISDFAKDISDIVRGSNTAVQSRRRIRRAVYTKHINGSSALNSDSVVDGTDDDSCSPPDGGCGDEIEGDNDHNNDNNRKSKNRHVNDYDGYEDSEVGMVNVELSQFHSDSVATIPTTTSSTSHYENEEMMRHQDDDDQHRRIT